MAVGKCFDHLTSKQRNIVSRRSDCSGPALSRCFDSARPASAGCWMFVFQKGGPFFFL